MCVLHHCLSWHPRSLADIAETLWFLVGAPVLQKTRFWSMLQTLHLTVIVMLSGIVLIIFIINLIRIILFFTGFGSVLLVHRRK